MALFRLLGPRRTRTVAQLIGVFTGLGILFFTRSLRNSGSGGFRPLAPWLEQSGFEPAARWLAQAATADPLPMLSLMAGSLLIFVAVVSLLGRRFAANASIAAGEAQPARRQASTPTAAFKTGGLRRIMIVKELKLLWRDPTLISQVLLQILYLPLVMYLSLTAGSRGGPASFISDWMYPICAGAMAYVAGQLAAGLGWLTISAEEAPELLSVAPVTPDEVARAKVSAVVLPVAMVLGLLSLGLGVLSPWAGFVAFAGSIGGAVVIAYIELWMQRPGKRSAFRMRRRGSGSVWVSLLEAFICMLLGAVTIMAAAGTLLAVIPGLLLVAIVGLVASVNKDKWLSKDA
jgi:ABC-2 type transport system permease protein